MSRRDELAAALSALLLAKGSSPAEAKALAWDLAGKRGGKNRSAANPPSPYAAARRRKRRATEKATRRAQRVRR